MKRYFLIIISIPFILCNREIKTVFYIQPYLQNVTQQGISVLWWTEDSYDSNFVFFSDSNSYLQNSASNIFVPTVGKYLHEAEITNLTAETSYHYFVQSGNHFSRRFTFQTAVHRDSDFHFVVLGDGRTDNKKVIKNHRHITKLAWQQHPHIAFHIGDLVYSGDQLHWDRFWRRIATNSDVLDPGLSFASFIPYYLAVGNHEIYSKETKYNDGNLNSSMLRFKAYTCNPPNNSSNPQWEERYYSYQYGVATFIILDTNNTSDNMLDNHFYLPDGSTPDWEPGSEQYNWLIEKLIEAQQQSAFTFVLMHPAPYSRGTHGDPAEVQSGWQIRILDPIFRQYGVDAVFCSHDHLVERCLTGPENFHQNFDEKDPLNLNYFVMGNSGESARPAAENWQTWMNILNNDSAPYYTRYFYDWAESDHYSFLDIDIKNLQNGNWKATFQVIRDDGKCFDRFSITRELPGRDI